MGSFALGYLMGMTLSGPNYTPDGYGDNFDEKELKRINDEMYWNAWDSAVKQGVIEKLRNHETGYRFLASSCPNMSQDEQADLIESGELKILAPLDGYNKDGLGVMWTDENREEAKHPIYLQGLEIFKEHIKNKKYRVVS